MNKRKNLGQVFTPAVIVDFMISLMRNKGSVLEPSAGNGAFTSKIDAVSVELDKTFNQHLNIDFFDYDITSKFDSIIGNPPYVKGKEILLGTRKLFNKNFKSILNPTANLYLRFIEKCFHQLEDDGELIFIVPKSLFHSTQAHKLNKLLMSEGSYTHVYDEKFPEWDARLEAVIFRYQKGLFSNTSIKNGKKVFSYSNDIGQLFFTEKRYTVNMKDLVNIKVSPVPKPAAQDGDDIQKFITSKGIYKSYDISNEANWLRPPKKLNKKLIHFSPLSREKVPFKVYNEKFSLCFTIDPKYDTIDIDSFCFDLNNIDWKELGFLDDNRYNFGQKSLQNTFLPDHFKKYNSNRSDTK